MVAPPAPSIWGSTVLCSRASSSMCQACVAATKHLLACRVPQAGGGARQALVCWATSNPLWHAGCLTVWWPAASLACHMTTSICRRLRSIPGVHPGRACQPRQDPGVRQWWHLHGWPTDCPSFSLKRHKAVIMSMSILRSTADCGCDRPQSPGAGPVQCCLPAT